MNAKLITIALIGIIVFGIAYIGFTKFVDVNKGNYIALDSEIRVWDPPVADNSGNYGSYQLKEIRTYDKTDITIGSFFPWESNDIKITGTISVNGVDFDLDTTIGNQYIWNDAPTTVSLYTDIPSSEFVYGSTVTWDLWMGESEGGLFNWNPTYNTLNEYDNTWTGSFTWENPNAEPVDDWWPFW